MVSISVNIAETHWDLKNDEGTMLSFKTSANTLSSLFSEFLIVDKA